MSLSPENMLYVKQEDIAPWVPAAVRKFAPYWEVDGRSLRLLTDKRMREVWRYLVRQKPADLAAFDAPYFSYAKEYLFSDGSNFSPSEIGCVVFFHRVQRSISGDVVSRAELEEIQKPRLMAATVLRGIESGLAAVFDPKLGECAAYVREYLEGNAAESERAAALNIVERRGKDDATRVLARRVAAVTKSVFGSPLYGTVATTVSVLTDVDVDRNEIEKWIKAPQ